MLSDIPIATEIYPQYVHVITPFQILTVVLGCVFYHMMYACKCQPEIRPKKAEHWHTTKNMYSTERCSFYISTNKY